MAAAALSFRWLEILEKEFDKAFVDLDLLLGEIDPDQCEITYEGRQKMTALSAAFAQLCHKSQTIFQSNAKLEVSTQSDSVRVEIVVLNHSVGYSVTLVRTDRFDFVPRFRGRVIVQINNILTTTY